MSDTRSLAELSAMYVPRDRLHAIAAGRELPELQRGSVLLADISGFTPLTEELLRQFGPQRGGEELTRHLNAVYNALLDQVERFRGSVVGFSGDAATCWFPDDDGMIAATCGVQIQQSVGRSRSLAIKVAIASGTARRFVVGDPKLHVVDVLCGSLLDRVAHAEGLAKRGELVVTREVVAAADSRLAVARWAEPDQVAIVGGLDSSIEPAGWPALDVAALDVESLRRFVLPAVYDRLQSGQGDYLSEVRQVVAMFVRFQGLDFDRDDAVGAKLDAFVRWVQSVIEHHEGALLQLTTGDKGSYLYAVFGAPIAHEDASARALEAALTLRAPPESAFVTATQIGISRGRLCTGAYGGDRRRTYGALGDETNVAARLMMKAAPGRVLATDHVVKSAGPRYEFRSLGDVALKGKRDAIAVAELVGRKVGRGKRPTREPSIGRDAERARLGEVLDRVVAGERGHTIVIEGDAGIGKSRLVQHLVDRARTDGITCAVTAGRAVERHVPYHVLRRLFAPLFNVSEPFDREVARARLTARMPPALVPMMPLLESVFPLGLTDTPATVELRGPMRGAATRRLLVAFADAILGPRPVVLVVEDAHLVDSASWETLLVAREQIERLLLVVTQRPQSMPEALASSPHTHHIRLAPMAASEIEALVARHLGAALPPDVAALVNRRAEGNPMFAEELASALREAGVIEIKDGVCHVRHSLDKLPFPETLEGLVTSRIDRLPPNVQLTLKVASVLGRVFQIAPLTGVFPVVEARTHVPEYVDALARNSLAAVDETGAFTFTHAVTHDVAYNLMLFKQRCELHERLGDWFEAALATDPSLYALHAYHREKAIEGVASPTAQATRRALDAVMHAGQRAMVTGATVEAIAYFGRARALLERMPRSRELRLIELDLCAWLGAALAVSKGPLDPAVHAELARADALCEEVGDKARLFEAMFNQWYMHLTGSERDGALEFSQRMLDIAGDEESEMLMHALHARGATLIGVGQHASGRESIKRSLTIARRSSRVTTAALAQARDPVLIAHCYLAWASMFLGFPAQALEEVGSAVAVANQAAHPVNLAIAHCFTGITHRYRGEPDEAERHGARAFEISKQHGFPFWAMVALEVLAWAKIERGEVAAAIDMLEELARQDRAAEVYPQVWIHVRADLIDALTRCGRYDDALDIVDEAKHRAEGRLLEFGLPEIHRLEGELWKAQGDTDRARAAFESAIELSRAHGARMFELRTELSYLEIDPGRRASLAKLYATFTEGFDVPDLVRARAVLAIDAAPAGACDLEGVKTYVLGRLARELTPELHYHCVEHTRDDVFPAALELAARHELSRADTTLVATAALFHDLGFVERRSGHEQVGVRIAREMLPNYGYTPEQIEAVAGIIMATKLPQTPMTLLGQIMADADLDVLGRDDFFEKNDALRQELASFGKAIPRETWYAQQLEFVRGHRYFTDVANEWRGPGKQRNIAELERRLERAKAGTR